MAALEADLHIPHCSHNVQGRGVGIEVDNSIEPNVKMTNIKDTIVLKWRKRRYFGPLEILYSRRQSKAEKDYSGEGEPPPMEVIRPMPVGRWTRPLKIFITEAMGMGIAHHGRTVEWAGQVATTRMLAYSDGSELNKKMGVPAYSLFPRREIDATIYERQRNQHGLRS